MDNGSSNPNTRAMRRYFFELGFSIIAYTAVLYASRWLLVGTLRHATNGWQLAVALTPMIPVIFVFIAIVRCVLGVDELQRRIYVDSLAVAGGATALLLVAYGLIEGDHLPKLSVFWPFAVFMMIWLVASFVVRRRYQ
jgi:hypothetical protein